MMRRAFASRPSALDRLLPLLIVALVVVGCGGSSGNGGGVEGRVVPAGDAADGLVVKFGSDPDPLKKGDNALYVTVERDGAPLTDAEVSATFSMPAMPSMNMPAMRSDATLKHEAGGTYRGTGELSMGGTWDVTIVVKKGEETLATRRMSIVAQQ